MIDSPLLRYRSFNILETSSSLRLRYFPLLYVLINKSTPAFLHRVFNLGKLIPKNLATTEGG
jgi:hypothetical protein